MQIENNYTLLQAFNKLQFKTNLTLSYLEDIYPSDEKQIKVHFVQFLQRLFPKKKKITYFYFYAFDPANKVVIHLLSPTDFSTSLALTKVQKIWGSIIGTTAVGCVVFTPISETFLINLIHTVYTTITNSMLLSKLGIDARCCCGGSAALNPILTLFDQDLRERPLNVTCMSQGESLSSIRKQLYDSYATISPDLIDREIILELQAYSDVLDVLKLEDLELFLSQSKSRISSGYLKFFRFLNKISEQHVSSFKSILNTWFQSSKRFSRYVHFTSLIFYLNVSVEDKFYSRLLVTVLDYTIKGALRGQPFIFICEKLGQYLFTLAKNSDQFTQNELIAFLEKYREEDLVIFLRYAGDFCIKVLKKVFIEKFEFTRIQSDVDDDLFLEEESLDNGFASSIYLNFNFNSDWLHSLKTKISINVSTLNSLFKVTKPMLVQPKAWVFSNSDVTSLASKTKILYSITNNCTGGLLLNNFFFQKPFQKPPHFGHKHKLAVSKDVFSAVNKLQNVRFCVNKLQLFYLKKYKIHVPDFVNSDKMKLLRREKKMQLVFKKSLFIERKQLHDIGGNLQPVIAKIRMCLFKIEEIDSVLSKHFLFLRVLEGFGGVENEDSFFYSYEFDFRMRLYPQQAELAPQSSKLARSLVKFVEQFEFNVTEFMLYSVRLYTKIYVFDEPTLFSIFNLKVKPLLQLFIADETKAIVRIFNEATETYLFLAACIEYKQYQLCVSRHEKYYTGFPIILDCSGSGPQIVSLLFLMDQFSQFLNLKPNTHRYDFYIAVVKRFLEQKKINDFIDIESLELLNILRGICKSAIMTQLYGVTFRKVSHDLRFSFSKNEKLLCEFLHQNIDYSFFVEKFIKTFWDFLRQLPLFKLRSFFDTINKFLEQKNAVLSWTVLENSQIVVDYRRHKNKKLDFKDQILGRTQVTAREGSLERDYKKQKTSAQANFIHSIDAYINFCILSNYSSSIFSNHDSWGVGMGTTETLRSLVATIYKDLAINNDVLKGFIVEFSELLKVTVSDEASQSFLNFCSKELDLGSYDPENLTLCKYMVYFGS
jgi:hypothetical protein